MGDNTMTAPGDISIEPDTAPLVASVRDLQVHFKTKTGALHAVDGVSFDIHDGETLGLVGETGCGKSVTARSFIRLVPSPPGVYAGGRIDFWSSEGRRTGDDPVDLLTIPHSEMLKIRGDRIAMIFQDPGKALNPALSIRDQVAEVFLQHRSADLLEPLGPEAPLVIRRAAHQQARGLERFLLRLPPLRAKAAKVSGELDRRIAQALAETQIPNPRKIMARYPHELSGGMKQRVLIAQALACNPDLLIADEPTTALDVTIQARILDLIAELQQRHKASVLYISHDLSLVREISDRVAVMYAGRIAEIGRTDQVFSDPLHPYTRGLMAAVPTSTHKRGGLAAIEGAVPELVDPPPSCRFHSRCPYEAEVCKTVDPRLIDAGDQHGVACHIHDSASAIGVEPHQLPSFDRRTR
ncbi:MAG: ATP-binding cassette domain-containing protein [Acidimicrobiia bacterium]|nr:ATP-binding cassette domain-containing protein [Acidimicrobiia bacterium]